MTTQEILSALNENKESEEKIFYSISILAVLWELYIISNSRQVYAFLKVLYYKSSLMENEKKVNLTTTEAVYGILNGSYWGWLACGFFSINCPIFVFLLLCEFFEIRRTYRGMIINSLLSCSLLSFIFVNKFFLHYDLIIYLRNLIH